MTRPAWVKPGGFLHPFNVPINPPPGDPYEAYFVDGYNASFIDPYGNSAVVYADRLWRAGSPNQPGNWNIKGNEYTYPIYYVEDATDTYTIQGGPSEINGTSIPWNPAWTPSAPQILSCTDTNSSGDAQVIVLEKATGKEWDLWKVFVRNDIKKVCIQRGSVVGTEVEKAVPGNTTANIYTKENGWKLSRGMGMNYIMGLVVPEEIEAGVIEHALSMPITPTSRKFFIKPATKLEHTGTEVTDPIPEGMRFYLDVLGTGYGSAEEAVDAWIAVKHATKTAQIKAFARIMGIALFKYGWYITDTAGHADWQIESISSAGALWSALGIDPTNQTIKDLMDGLIVPPAVDPLYPEEGLVGGNLRCIGYPRVAATTNENFDVASSMTVWTQPQGLP